MSQTIAFVIGNNGPNISPATTVSFPGLDMITLDSVKNSEGIEMLDTEFDRNSLTWNVGELTVGETSEINITATNITGVDVEVVANISGRLRDPDMGNNSASWVFTDES